ncbi:MAG: hypothetical protein WCE54_15070 [Ignavibacteriaceae bacterium]
MDYHLNIKKNYKLTLLVILLTAVLRIYFAEQNYYGISTDPANFILAVKSYNLTEDQPHLPGYYLHIQLIKLVKILTGNTHTAMLILSILYSSLSAGFLFLLFRYWFDIKISLLLTLLVITNPMVWYYGCTTEIYSFDLFFSVVLAWLGLNPVGIYFTPLFLGLFSGVRPSSGILILGLYLFLWYKYFKSGSFSIKKAILSHLGGLAGFLFWLIPLLNAAGGLRKYLALYSTNSPLPEISILQNWYTILSYAVFISFPFIALIIFLLVHSLKNRNVKESGENQEKILVPKDFLYLMLSWSVPPLLFFFFYYYAKGYLLLCIVPVLSIIIVFIHKRKAFLGNLLLIIIIQSAFFCLWPYKQPETRLFFSPNARHLSLSKVWLERTCSVYLMAQSHIRSMEKSEDEIGRLISYLSRSTHNLKDKLIFIDPTVSIRARALQAEYPELKFGAISLTGTDEYKIYNNTEVFTRKGLDKMFKEAFILSRSGFAVKYIKDIIPIRNSGQYLLYRIQPEESGMLANVYSSLFLHIK